MLNPVDFSGPKTRACLVTTISLLALVAHAKTPWTPYDSARLQYVSSAHLSPNGKHVAYRLSVPRVPFTDADGGAWTQLHVVDSSGKSRVFVGGQVSVSGVGWLHDSSAITFLAKRAGDAHKALYTLPVDGGEASRLYAHPSAGIGTYSLSPHSKRIAYLVPEGADNGAGKASGQGFKYEVYEEDMGRTVVYVAPIDGGEPTKMELKGSASDVVWSPKGDFLAVTAAPTPTTDNRYMRSRVHIVNAKTGKTVATAQGEGKVGHAAWSPNGQRIALISAADIHDPRAGRVRVIDAATGKSTLLFGDYLGHVFSVGWQGNDTLVYVADAGVFSTVGQIDANGKNQKTWVAPGKHVLSGLSLSAAGNTYVTIGESATHHREVFMGAAHSASPRRLTHHNPWIADKQLAKQEVVTYKARDGQELQAVMMRPADSDQKRGLPLILHIHGGPESHVRAGWNTSYGYLGHAAAARGFVVLWPNYRGSTGRGVAFSKLSQADAAGKEFDDFVDAADHLIGLGLVDKDRVGISGGSYGGYAAAWAATRYSHRFAAAVMFVGISNKISKSGTTDIADEEFLVHTRKRPWKNWQWFLERSPIFFVERHKTPLLIAHGKDDLRVNKGQAMELYRHLKILAQAPVRLVFYPGEGHGNRKAAARLDYSMRLLRWMERFLIKKDTTLPPLGIDYGKTWKTTTPVE